MFIVYQSFNDFLQHASIISSSSALAQCAFVVLNRLFEEYVVLLYSLHVAFTIAVLLVSYKVL